MNRLREQRNLEGRARWQLAAAYWYAGQRDAARTMVQDLSMEAEPYRELSGTFGSDLRDRAIILETLAGMNGGLNTGGRIPALFQSISETLASEKWLSTQETAYALIAAVRVLGDTVKLPLSVDVVFQGQRRNVSFETPVSTLDLGSAEGGPGGRANVRFENPSGSPVYIRAMVRGRPAEGSEPELSQGLALSVEYRDMNGGLVNPDSLRLGEDLEIRVTLKNTDPDRALQELALVHPLPANYEIVNTRLGGARDVSSLKYQDIRDDRVLSYFDLGRGASKTVSFTVNRVYEGSFYQPAVRAYAMYDESICALIPGKR
jgi:uncharacterized protein YfaS (alpha-2-macroglobulin family)